MRGARAVISLWVKVVALTRVTSLSIEVALMTTSEPVLVSASRMTPEQRQRYRHLQLTAFKGNIGCAQGKTVSLYRPMDVFGHRSVERGMAAALRGLDVLFLRRSTGSGSTVCAIRISGNTTPQESHIYQSVSNCGHILRGALSRLVLDLYRCEAGGGVDVRATVPLQDLLNEVT